MEFSSYLQRKGAWTTALVVVLGGAWYWWGASGTAGERVAKQGTAGAALFRQYCQRCHGADGMGGGAGAPDFTRPGWHDGRSDIQLVVSILEGKGTGMPAFHGRLDRAEAADLIAHVRNFAPGRSLKGSGGLRAADFEERFQRLQKQYDELAKQLHELDRLAEERSAPAASAVSLASAPARSSSAPFRPTAVLYTRFCARCHGKDGQARSSEFPDFASIGWHEQHTDSQLVHSILEGTHGGMPSFRRRLSESEAGRLVDHIRDFASTGTASR